jgi:hypothetical protein
MLRRTFRRLRDRFVAAGRSVHGQTGSARPPACPACGCEWRSYGLPLDRVAVERTEDGWACRRCGADTAEAAEEEWWVV